MDIYGTFIKTLFMDYKTGMSSYVINPAGNCAFRNRFGNLECEGTPPACTTGTPVCLSGEFRDGRFISKQYAVKSADRFTAISYLSSEVFPGIGEATASLIVDKFGNNIFEALNAPDAADQLVLIPKITREKADKILDIIKSTKEKKDLMDYLNSITGSFRGADVIFSRYGKRALEQIKKHPYSIGVWAGIDFYSCDNIANRENIPFSDQERVIGIINEALSLSERKGNYYIRFDELMQYTGYIENKSLYQERLTIYDYLLGIQNSNQLILSNKLGSYFLYNRQKYNDEVSAVFNINRLMNRTSTNFVADYIKSAEVELGVKYSESQIQSFDVLKRTGINIITGGPGTGKTTVTRGIISAYQKMYPENGILLMAPSGRAAKRMTEATGMPARTIHKCLDFKKIGNTVTHRTKDNPFTEKLIIIDESSMLGESLFSFVLECVTNGSILVLIGDINQLPSVSPGNVLHDLIESGRIPCYRLNTIYRQKIDSSIVFNSELVLSGKTELKTGQDFEIINTENENAAFNIMMSIASKNDVSDINRFQILSPIKRNALGIREINRKIQESFNKKPELIRYGDTIYRRGDKVIFNTNNYELNYLNGDIMVLEGITENEMLFFRDGEHIGIDKSCIKDLSLAYAMTIHKAQGSEYDTVMVLLPKTMLLQRNLLLTAITRAKKKVYLINIEDGIKSCINNTDVEKRNSSLGERIKKAASKDAA